MSVLELRGELQYPPTARCFGIWLYPALKSSASWGEGMAKYIRTPPQPKHQLITTHAKARHYKTREDEQINTRLRYVSSAHRVLKKGCSHIAMQVPQVELAVMAFE